MGFAIRAGILGTWAEDFGFTMLELGKITGGGLIGFGVVVLIGGFLINLVGYKKLLIIAFLLHFVSAAMTLSADAVFAGGGKDAVYQILFWGMFLFAIGNGICEAVINPLTSDIYPEQKTHYLNILHAGWPGGLVIGGLVALLNGKGVSWEILIATFLIPVVIYGAMTLMNKFPRTSAQDAGIGYGKMLAMCLSPFLILLLIVHALVGYVELGTDSWITKITGNILGSGQKGLYLFIYASMLMFILRFFAGPIVHRISSLGLLCGSAVLGAIGLYLISISNNFGIMFLAVSIYGVGKTFLWPTMLGVVGERFPTAAPVAMGLLGAAGMLSAGFLGGPGIGYKQDVHATAHLKANAPAVYDRLKAGEEKGFLFFEKVAGLDGSKVGMVSDNGKAILEEKDRAGDRLDSEELKPLRDQLTWWEANKGTAEADAGPVGEAGIHGSRMAIRLTAIIPAIMALLYLLMILGFKAKGGYKQVEHKGVSSH